MKWLEKMDAVLLCLDKLSDSNPKFSDLEEWLNKNYPNKVHKGEIQDITLYLWKEEMMYFDDGGGHRLSEYDDRKEDGHYLISCKGKLLRENPGGFMQQKINQDFEHNNLKVQAKATLRLTVVLAVAALPVGFLALADLYWKYRWFQDAYIWRVVVLSLMAVAATWYVVTKLLNQKR